MAGSAAAPSLAVPIRRSLRGGNPPSGVAVLLTRAEIAKLRSRPRQICARSRAIAAWLWRNPGKKSHQVVSPQDERYYQVIQCCGTHGAGPTVLIASQPRKLAT